MPIDSTGIERAIMLHMRKTKSYTIDTDIGDYVERTKGKASASERVNALLRRAMAFERLQNFEAEAAAFFSVAGDTEREEARAFRKASIRAVAKD